MRFQNLLIGAGIVTFLTALVLGMAGNNAQAASSFGTARWNGDCSTFATLGSVPGGAQINAGGVTIAVGYRQVSSINKDPIVAAYDAGGNQIWCRTNFEASPVDGEARGLAWSGSALYVFFRVDGGIGGGFVENFATGGGWLPNLAGAGSGSFTVVTQVDPNSGASLRGTYLHTRLASNGNPNSYTVNSASFNGSNLVVNGNAAAYPINTDRSVMGCDDSIRPYNWTIELSGTLGQALGSASNGCISASPAPGGQPGGPIDPGQPVDPGQPGQPGQPAQPAAPAYAQDGRLNSRALAGPVAIYCGNTGGDVVVYGIDFATSAGYLLFVASGAAVDDALAQAVSSGNHVTIESVDGTALYALSSNELQVNSFEQNGSLYEFIFPPDRCG